MRQRRYALLPNLKRYHQSGILLAACLSAGLNVAVTSAVSAQDKQETEKELRALEATLEKKNKAKNALDRKVNRAESDAEKISEGLVSAAGRIRLFEGNAIRIERRITILEEASTEKKTSLDQRQDELLDLLSALERLAKRPAVLALLQPSEALKTARSASLMGEIVPEISVMADALKTDLKTLTDLQADLSVQRFDLKNTLAGLTEHQLKLASLLEKRKGEASTSRTRANNVAQEIRRYTADAKSLRELLEKLARVPKTVIKPTPERATLPDTGFRTYSRPIAELKGSLPQPAIGRIVSRFGDKETAGTARGIKIRTRANAQVVAPFDGQIVFAGPFRDYGQLLIIEHGGGYYSLMAGFGSLHSAVGQWVLTGEPVGIMTASVDNRDLYVEMRRRGKAINPEPWLQKQIAQIN
ncbi:MAG: peptidoglycan DD-metalloendopeptidase family protein [Kordiimonadaceae bacterium]|nr:peptidoglycan DD-metalloendopeptidase family protein [Kordiimonadaceae bacterium]